MSKKILLDKINVPGIKTYEVYRKNGGYASVEKALKQCS
jgi:NADH-quinone oxidoreductase subunit F